MFDQYKSIGEWIQCVTVCSWVLLAWSPLILPKHKLVIVKWTAIISAWGAWQAWLSWLLGWSGLGVAVFYLFNARIWYAIWQNAYIDSRIEWAVAQIKERDKNNGNG